jgi:hypothetical protein
MSGVSTSPTSRLRIIKRGPDLTRPSHTPSGETWHYQVSLPFQVAPRQAAVFCNLRKGYALGVDFEVGVDIIFFDDLSHVSAEYAVPLTRNHEEPNPHTTPPGAPSVMVKYPARGGFVPLGAKRADGSAHPCAGSGFAINQALAWPLTVRAKPPYDAYDYVGAEHYAYFELHQLANDGKTFRVLSTERLSFTDVLPEWHISDGAMTNPIPAGDDFLVGLAGGKLGADVRYVMGGQTRGGGGTGVMRFRRQQDGWRPVSFVPVSGNDDSFEPSLIRDVDGALLFGARGTEEPECYDIRIWRSRDGGETWSRTICVRGVVSRAPISINQAANGAPYVAANLYQVYLYPRAAHLRVGRDAAGNVGGGGWTREVLCLWPLNDDRAGLGTPIVARDLRAEFGPPPAGSDWRIDHPSGATLRLADGAWHHVLASRVLETAEITNASPPTPQTGTYLQEVLSDGPALPSWIF